MLLQRTNIQKKLALVKKKDSSPEIILQEVYDILQELDVAQDRIAQNLGAKSTTLSNRFDYGQLKTSEIYHIRHIEQIAINYRLRFLDSHYFKGEIPQEAISKIRKLERAHGVELQGFKILAPSKLFALENPDDPILFVPIDKDYYYLIHKWGKDLHPLRRLLMWPYKSIGNLFLSVIFISYALSLLVPMDLFSRSSTLAQFLIVYFFIFKMVATIVIYYAFAKGKNFSRAIWKSRFLKT